VYRLLNTGTKLAGYEELFKSRSIYACANSTETCVLECMFIAIYGEENYKKIHVYKFLLPKLKLLYKELFNEEFPKDFRG
jgi:hypothetical protein